MREAVDRGRQPRAGALDEARRERARRLDADLLPEHRAHGALERVPCPRDPQAGPAANQRAEEWVGAERRLHLGGVGGEVERAPCVRGDPQERGEWGAGNAQLQRVRGAGPGSSRCAAARRTADAHHRRPRVERERPRIAVGVDALDAGHRARTEEAQDAVEVVRRPQREPEHQRAGIGRRRRVTEPAQRARWPVVGREERGVEPPQRAVARRDRDLRHREVGLVHEPLREVEASGLRDRHRRRADVRDEQAVEVAGADAYAGGERLDRRVVESAVVDERQRAAHDRRRAEPRRRAGRRLRPAAQAGPEAGVGGRGRTPVVAHVRGARARRRTDGPAVDAGRGDCHEEAAVEPRVARSAGPVEDGAGWEHR